MYLNDGIVCLEEFFFFAFFFCFVFFGKDYLCVCMYVYICACTSTHAHVYAICMWVPVEAEEGVVELLGAKVSGAVGCLAWMLRTKLCSSGRTASAVSHGDIFLALVEEIFALNNFI